MPVVWMKPSKNWQLGNYDVVVSDYEMPQKDGLQFLKELREQNNEIPFILFTGKGREEVAIQSTKSWRRRILSTSKATQKQSTANSNTLF